MIGLGPVEDMKTEGPAFTNASAWVSDFLRNFFPKLRVGNMVLKISYKKLKVNEHTGAWPILRVIMALPSSSSKAPKFWKRGPDLIALDWILNRSNGSVTLEWDSSCPASCCSKKQSYSTTNPLIARSSCLILSDGNGNLISNICGCIIKKNAFDLFWNSGRPRFLMSRKILLNKITMIYPLISQII